MERDPARQENTTDIKPDGTEQCINCGEEVTADGMHVQSGIKVEGLKRLLEGESVPFDALMQMDDGPYCSIGCSINSATDGT